MSYVLVPVFPGTNCDAETKRWIEDNLLATAELVDSRAASFSNENDVAAVVVPGGFSYGDYLRAGALAARSNVMRVVAGLAARGVPVLGICNGFQILCESGLLPGVLVKNITRQHHHFPVALQLVAGESGEGCCWLPRERAKGDLNRLFSNFRLPMSCGMGRYLPASGTGAWRPLLRYIDNENGSHDSIAGICNSTGNIVGMMPHPERASDPIIGSMRGLLFLLGLAEHTNLVVRSGSALELFAKEFGREVCSR